MRVIFRAKVLDVQCCDHLTAVQRFKEDSWLLSHINSSQLTNPSMQCMAINLSADWQGLPCRTYIWQDNELARPSTASPSRRHSIKREMLGETPSYLSDATPIGQEQIVYNDTIPAVSQQEMHYSRKVFVSASTRAGHISHEIDRAEEPLYAPRTGPEQAEAMADYTPRALEQGASRDGFSADAESLVSSPESTPRSTACTPRSASRPATPRERVQHQIMLSQQKRRMRRQVCSCLLSFGRLQVHNG